MPVSRNGQLQGVTMEKPKADRSGGFLPWPERPAYWMDIYRVWPRLILTFYALSLWRVTEWFMDLKEPSNAQGAFVSVVYGALPFLCNFYFQNGVDWEARRKSEPTFTTTATVTTTEKQ
jgi:hypothetical protein